MSQLAYVPPENFVAASQPAPSEFSMQEIDGKDLCILRLPKSVNCKLLDGMTLKLPAKGDSKMPSSVVGQIEHSGFKFTVIESRPSPDGDFADGSIPAAQELQSMNILLPNDGEDNGLVFAPCKPTRFFTVTRNVDVPDPTEAAKRILVTPYVPQAHPANMKFRFKPNGFDTGIPIAQQKMEIEEAREEVTTPVKKKAKKSNKSGKTPGSDKKSKKSTKTPIIKSRDSSKHDDD